MIKTNKPIVAGMVVGLLIVVFLYKDQLVRPKILVLQVPFSQQAPHNNWENNEDCEETSIVMANAFLSGNMENVLPVNLAQEGIDKLKKWERENLGYILDTGADATALMASQVYGLKVRQ